MSYRRLLTLVLSPLTAAALFTAVAAPASATPLPPRATPQSTGTGTLTTPVDLTVQTAQGAVHQTGSLVVNQFTHQGNQIFAVGSLTSGGASTPVSVPLVRQDPTCSILNLVLGPLDLTLLGLHVHLNQVVLTIDAQSGPGNLLGNLLCAIANLLNGGVPTVGQLTNLLNQLLAAL